MCVGMLYVCMACMAVRTGGRMTNLPRNSNNSGQFGPVGTLGGVVPCLFPIKDDFPCLALLVSCSLCFFLLGTVLCCFFFSFFLLLSTGQSSPEVVCVR